MSIELYKLSQSDSKVGINLTQNNCITSMLRKIISLESFTCIFWSIYLWRLFVLDLININEYELFPALNVIFEYIHKMNVFRNLFRKN